MLYETEEDYGFKVEKARENYENAVDLLITYFKTVYENAGLEWGEKDEVEIKKIMESIIDLTYWNSVKMVLETEKLKNNKI